VRGEGGGGGDLHESEFLVDEQGRHGTRAGQEHHPEGVLLLVVRLPHPLVHPHVVQDGQGGGEENHLHQRVVPAVPPSPSENVFYCVPFFFTLFLVSEVSPSFLFLVCL